MNEFTPEMRSKLLIDVQHYEGRAIVARAAKSPPPGHRGGVVRFIDEMGRVKTKDGGIYPYAAVRDDFFDGFVAGVRAMCYDDAQVFADARADEKRRREFGG